MLKLVALTCRLLSIFGIINKGSVGLELFHTCIFAYVKRKVGTSLIQQKFSDIQLDSPLWNHSIVARAASLIVAFELIF